MFLPARSIRLLLKTMEHSGLGEENSSGQLGNGLSSNSYLPVEVLNLTNIEKVALGAFHNIAVDSSGYVWVWGNNNYGQLGDGTLVNKSTPFQLSGLSGITDVDSGGLNSIVIGSGGNLYAWGDNDFGELGTGSLTEDLNTPTQVLNISNIISIHAGSRFMAAIESDGTLWTWGQNQYYQLGDGTTTDSATPIEITAVTAVSNADVGGDHTIVISSTGQYLWAWGYNYQGQLGDSTTTTRSTPVTVPGVNWVEQVECGYNFSLALTTGGTLWGWGANYYGQLGDGTTTSTLSPVEIPNFSDVEAISVGSNYVIALKNDGTAWAWGMNDLGQLGDGTTTNRYSPVIVGGWFNLDG